MSEAGPNQISERGQGVIATAVLGAGAIVTRADSAAVEKLVSDLQSSDEAVRGAAWQDAATLGAPAVKPLAALMTHQDFEIARSAKRALWKIVRHAARPRADKERKAVQAELLMLLFATPLSVCREALWMLSEFGDSSVVEDVAKLLREAEICEDARCALERMPTSKATQALERAMETAPVDFRPALANSLRVRGHDIRGYPSQKLKPSRQTSVEPKK